MGASEAFYLLEGTITLTAGDQMIRARKGDFAHLPKGTVHSLHHDGGADARMLLIFSPAGMEA